VGRDATRSLERAAQTGAIRRKRAQTGALWLFLKRK
jgi:hypothetical protein